MLTQEQWNKVEKQAGVLYSDLELDIIKELATRIV